MVSVILKRPCIAEDIVYKGWVVAEEESDDAFDDKKKQFRKTDSA